LWLIDCVAPGQNPLRVGNPSLTLAGIAPAVFDYRLGNRSALDWVIDQYRVTEDARSGIRSDPGRRSQIHRPPGRPGGPCQRRDGADRERVAGTVCIVIRIAN
jgi:hypothetical protein